MPEAINLSPYDPQWPRLFQAEAARIRSVLAAAIIEHVGSTSVPGLMAKPFIDILVCIEDAGLLPAAIPALESLSYHYVPEAEKIVSERRFFRKIDHSPGFHVHVVARSAPLHSNLLLFRDTLRSSASTARQYLALKLRLAESHSTDVDAYTLAKGPFVEGVLQSARAGSNG